MEGKNWAVKSDKRVGRSKSAASSFHRKLRRGEMSLDETCSKDSNSKRAELRLSEFPCLHLVSPQTVFCVGLSTPATPACRPSPAHPAVYWLLRARDQLMSQPMEVAHGETFSEKPKRTREPGNARGGPVRKPIRQNEDGGPTNGESPRAGPEGGGG